jgi:hypothetical protein
MRADIIANHITLIISWLYSFFTYLGTLKKECGPDEQVDSNLRSQRRTFSPFDEKASLRMEIQYAFSSTEHVTSSKGSKYSTVASIFNHNIIELLARPKREAMVVFSAEHNPLLIFFGIFIGLRCSVVGSDAVFNFPRKKRLLDEYASVGVDYPAFVTCHKVTRRLTNCIETSRDHEIKYAYKIPGSSQLVVHTEFRTTFPYCSYEPTASFLVTVLPGFPMSGIRKSRVDNRKLEFGVLPRCMYILFGLVTGVIVSAYMFARGVNTYHPSLLVAALTALFFWACGYMCGRNCNAYERWKRNTLQSGQLQTARSPQQGREEEYYSVPTADIAGLDEEAGGCAEGDVELQEKETSSLNSQEVARKMPEIT